MPRRAKNARRPTSQRRPARRDRDEGWDMVAVAPPVPPGPAGTRRAGARLLALDIGERRIGVAVSDERRRVAMPLLTLRRSAPEADLIALGALVTEWDVGAIVVGLPTGLSGREGPQAAVVRAWVIAAERAIDRPFDYWDERFSSLIAERALAATGAKADRQRGDIDALAAAVVLQGYLDSRRFHPIPEAAGRDDLTGPGQFEPDGE